jgi:hypothetical protein
MDRDKETTITGNYFKLSSGGQVQAESHSFLEITDLDGFSVSATLFMY